MCFFGRRRKDKKSMQNNKQVIANKKMIEQNECNIGVLIVMADDNEIKNDLERIKDIIKYIEPVSAGKAMELDKKIANIIGDIKIILSKEKNFEKIKDLIKKIEVCVAERKMCVDNMGA